MYKYKNSVSARIIVSLLVLLIFSAQAYAIGTECIEDAPDPSIVPNMKSVVDAVANEDWARFERSETDYDFLDELVTRLRSGTGGTKWAYNGKRANLNDPWKEGISYYYGQGNSPRPGTTDIYEVFAIDVAHQEPGNFYTDWEVVDWPNHPRYNGDGTVNVVYLYPRNAGGSGPAKLMCSAVQPPTITDIDPITAVPSQSVEVYGTNLGEEIQLLSSSGTTTNVTSSPNNQLTTTTFQVPPNIPSGSYKVIATNSKGSATSTQSLAIKVGGLPFSPSVTSNPPTQGLPTDLGQLIQQIFTWSLYILGVSVFVMFFYSGFLWLTAAGNTSRVGEAKTHMTNAVFGAILLLSSYLILYTINPDFVKNTFNLPGLGITTSPTPAPGGGTCSGPGLPVPPGSPPNGASVVNDVASEFPQYLANSCQNTGGTWEFMDEVVNRLHAQDPNWGYNGKRGGSTLSEDAISYLAGGTTEVFIIDVINGHCGSNPQPTWNDVTAETYACGVTGAYVYPR